MTNASVKSLLSPPTNTLDLLMPLENYFHCPWSPLSQVFPLLFFSNLSGRAQMLPLQRDFPGKPHLEHSISLTNFFIFFLFITLSVFWIIILIYLLTCWSCLYSTVMQLPWQHDLFCLVYHYFSRVSLSLLLLSWQN